MSLTNCSAPKEEKTTSKLPSANGRWVAVPSTDGTAMPAVPVDAAGVLELAEGQVEPDRRVRPGRAPNGSTGRRRTPPRARPARRPAPSTRASRLGESLGTPDEAQRRRGTRRAWPGTRRRSGPSRVRWPGGTRPRRPAGARPGPAGAADRRPRWQGTRHGPRLPWNRCRAAGPERRSSPSRRGSAAWSASTHGPATGARRRTRSTPRCCGWCAGWCRSPRCSECAGPTRPPDLPALLVTSWRRGRAGRRAAADARRRPRGPARAPRLGEVAAALGGMPTLTAGPFVDGELPIGTSPRR